MPPWARRLLLLLGTAAVALPGNGSAFDQQGHIVIEAAAYRSVVEGRDGLPARPAT